MNFSTNNPHQGQPILQSGLQPEKAKAAVLMIHGRGASAEDILTLADELEHPDFVYLAPQAYGNTWYPYPFMTPVQQNEPWLSSALGVIAALLEYLTQNGLPLEKGDPAWLFTGGVSLARVCCPSYQALWRAGWVERWSDRIARHALGLPGLTGWDRSFPGLQRS